MQECVERLPQKKLGVLEEQRGLQSRWVKSKTPETGAEDGLGQILRQINTLCEKQWEVIVGHHAEK